MVPTVAPPPEKDDDAKTDDGAAAPLTSLNEPIHPTTADPPAAVPPPPDVPSVLKDSDAVPVLSNFLSYLDGRSRTATQFLFYSLSALALTFVFFEPFFGNQDNSAWLVRALNSQLRDTGIRQRCLDDNCTASLSYNKTLLDVGDVDEFRSWLVDGLDRWLFYGETRNLSVVLDGRLAMEPAVSTVSWDPRVHMLGPLTVFQYRSRSVACPPSWPASSHETNCRFNPADERGWADRAFCTPEEPCDAMLRAVPDAWSVRNTSAVSPRFDCPLKYAETTNFFYGSFGDYLCTGSGKYSVDIANRSQLDSFVRSEWIDSSSRLVGIRGTFASASMATDGHDATGQRLHLEATVEFVVYVELGERGGGAAPRTIGTMIASSAVIRSSAWTQQLLGLRILAGLNLGWWLFLLLRYVDGRWRRGLTELQWRTLVPDTPVLTIVSCLWLFLIGPSLAAAAANGLLPPTVAASVAIVDGVVGVVYTTGCFTVMLVFPVASLVSKEVKTLIATLEGALTQIVYVAPFFIVFMLAFSVAGLIVFGRGAPEFSTFRWSFSAISLMTFSEEFDMQLLQRSRPQEAQIFAVLMLFTILITMLNMFLAMVTSACGEAQFTRGNVALTELLLRRFGCHVIYGQWVGSAVAMGRRWATKRQTGSNLPPTQDFSQRFADGAQQPYPHSICTASGRLLFPVEALMASFSPLQCNALLRFWHHRQLPPLALHALLPYATDEYNRFRDDVVQDTAELESERRLEQRLTEECIGCRRRARERRRASGYGSSVAPSPSKFVAFTDSDPLTGMDGQPQLSRTGAIPKPLQPEHLLSARTQPGSSAPCSGMDVTWEDLRDACAESFPLISGLDDIVGRLARTAQKAGVERAVLRDVSLLIKRVAQGAESAVNEAIVEVQSSLVFEGGAYESTADFGRATSSSAAFGLCLSGAFDAVSEGASTAASQGHREDRARKKRRQRRSSKGVDQRISVVV